MLKDQNRKKTRTLLFHEGQKTTRSFLRRDWSNLLQPVEGRKAGRIVFGFPKKTVQNTELAKLSADPIYQGWFPIRRVLNHTKLFLHKVFRKPFSSWTSKIWHSLKGEVVHDTRVTRCQDHRPVDFVERCLCGKFSEKKRDLLSGEPIDSEVDPRRDMSFESYRTKARADIAE